MNEYVIRTWVEYVLVIEAETKGAALEEAAKTDFNDWKRYCSEAYEIELVGKDGASGPTSETLYAVQAVVDYLWEDEKRHFEERKTNGHIFEHLVTIRSWFTKHAFTEDRDDDTPDN